MASCSRPRFYHRAFLNDDGFHGLAAVLARIEVEERDCGEPYRDAYLTISDCGRSITLDFGFCTKDEGDHALAKARRLRDVSADFCTALEAAIATLEPSRSASD